MTAPLGLTARAVATAVLVELGIRTIGLPALTRALGLRLDCSDATIHRGTVHAISPALASAVDRAIGILGMRNRPCLRRALVLGHLLKHDKPALRIGVARDRGRLSAHAWLEVGGVPVAENPQTLEQFRPLRQI